MTALERAALLAVSLVAAALLGGWLGSWAYAALFEAVDSGAEAVSRTELDASS